MYKDYLFKLYRARIIHKKDISYVWRELFTRPQPPELTPSPLFLQREGEQCWVVIPLYFQPILSSPSIFQERGNPRSGRGGGELSIF